MTLPAPANALRRVLVVDDEEGVRHMLAMLLAREGYQATAVGSAEAALAELEGRPFDVVLTDLRMPRVDGLQLVDEIRRRGVRATIIVMSAFGNLDVAIEAMKRGAYDYVAKPFKPDEVVLVLRKAEERERLFRENQSLRKRLAEGDGASRGLEALVGKSAPMQDVFKRVRKIAEYKTTVLVTGESGTGKELVARAIHACSPRVDKPFVAINCGAIPETLLESELFGYKKGAFTDATRDRKGLFEEASGGTLFLDEIGELPLALQVKLLRALQEETIRPVGATTESKIDVRVVAATVRDLPAEVASGRFREDLFYRLNVMQIHLPPLRERRDDIPVLLAHFVAKTNARLGMRLDGATPEALKLLVDHAWPGNVREFENTVERAMVLAEGDRIEATGLPEKIRDARERVRATLLSGELSIKKTARMMEQELIRRALKETRGNRTNAARLLEISHRALLYKIKEYRIDEEEKVDRGGGGGRM